MQPQAIPAHFNYYTAAVWTWTLGFLPHLASAIVILIVGFLVASWAGRALRELLARNHRVDSTLQPVAASVTRYVIIVIVLVVALSQLGIQTASLLAVLGAAGLAIGLALQGTLTNIAAGIMLMWLRPFRVGDYVEVPANNIAGTIIDVGLFVCHLESTEGVFVFAPNGALWNAALRNQSRISGRLVSFSVGLPAAASIETARAVLLTMLADDDRVLKNPAPEVFLDAFDAAAGATLNCTFRVQHGRAGEIQREVIERALERLKKSQIGAPRQIARIVPAAAELPRLVLARRTHDHA